MVGRREFQPDQLRILGRLAWMKDGDQGHWFSVPVSNDQLIFSEEGIFAHSLTGARIEILEIPAYYGNYPEVHPWDGCNPESPRFSDLVEYGERIYGALIDAGGELWSGDPDVLFQWSKSRVVFADESSRSFRVIARLDLKRLLSDARQAYTQENRAWKQRELAERAPKREQRDALQQSRQQWRASFDYDNLFSEVYGKSQSRLSDGDPATIISHAHCIVEYRLKLGRWALKSMPEDARPQAQAVD